jgi:hypothetical protein
MRAIVKQEPFERSVYWICLVLLGLILLIGGTVSTAMDQFFQVGMVLMAGILTFRRFTGQIPATVNRVQVPGGRMWVLFVLCIFFQAVPMPQTILGRLSPKALQDWLQAAAVVSSGDTGPDFPPSWFSVAYDAHPAMAIGTRLFACTILFYLLLYLLKSKKQINILVWLIVLCSAGKACQILFQKPLQPDIGSNGLLEIGLSLSAGLYLIHKNPSAPSAGGGLGRLQSFQQAIMHRLSADGFNVKAVLPVIIGMILVPALAMTGSTDGLVRAGAAVLLASACAGLREWPHIGIGITMGFLVAAVSVMVFTGFGSPGIANMMIDYPVWGVGGGNAVNLIPRYAESATSAYGFTQLAGGRLTKIGVETGLSGLLLLSAAGIIFIYHWAGVWSSRHDLHARGLGFAVMAACLMMLIGNSGVQSSDGLVPSVAFTATLAAGYAAIYRKGRGLMQSFIYPARQIQWSHSKQRVMAAVSILICLAALVFPISDLISAPSMETGPAVSPDQHALESRLLKNPASGKSWYQLARMYEQMDTDPLQYVTHWLPLADRCYAQAVKNRPADTELLFQAARYWVRRSVILPDMLESRVVSTGDDSVQTRLQGIQRFQDLFRRVITIDPDKLKPAAEAVRSYYPRDAIVLGIVPVQDASMRTQLLRHLSLQD